MGKFVILAFFVIGIGVVARGGLIMQNDEKLSSGKVHNVAVEERANAHETVEATVARGREAWDFIYIAFGFALTLESTIIPMLPFGFPYNLAIFIPAAGVTTWLFIFNGKFQDNLLALREAYEKTAR